MRVVLVDDDATAQLGASRQYRKPLGDLAGRTALTRELLCCLSTRASRGCPTESSAIINPNAVSM